MNKKLITAIEQLVPFLVSPPSFVIKDIYARLTIPKYAGTPSEGKYCHLTLKRDNSFYCPYHAYLGKTPNHPWQISLSKIPEYISSSMGSAAIEDLSKVWKAL